MTQLTEQEIKLQQKYAELRKKKELKRKQAEAVEAAKAQGPGEPGGSALDKAKAILAKKGASAPSNSVDKPVPAAGQKVDPILAAKRALEGQKKGSAVSKRPGLKRPTVQRAVPKPSPTPDDTDASPHSTSTVHNVAPAHRPAKRPAVEEEDRRDRPASSSYGAQEDQFHSHKRPRHEAGNAAPRAEHDTESTLFVGDLPPYYQNEDLYNVFAQWGEIEEIRIMGAQCYAFVKFHSAEVAQSLAQRFSREPLTASGHELRINLAHGQLPAWKRMSGCEGPRGGSRGQQHPKVMQAQQHGDALAQQLLAAGSHGLDFAAKPCAREIVTYDDL